MHEFTELTVFQEGHTDLISCNCTIILLHAARLNGIVVIQWVYVLFFIPICLLYVWLSHDDAIYMQ